MFSPSAIHPFKEVTLINLLKILYLGLSRAANAGFSIAQYKMGGMYENGIAVEKNVKKAFEWYLKAAQQSYAPAECMVGTMFYMGLGVDSDKKKAFDWLYKAAIHNEGKAQFNLGIMYYQGEGTALDKQEGIEWIQKAADQGVIQALSALESIALDMSSE